MTKILTFIVSGIVAGAFFYILKLVFSNVIAILLVTVESTSSPSPVASMYGADIALIAAGVLAFLAWVKLYRHMNTPKLI
jgi:hypothetical protein